LGGPGLDFQTWDSTNPSHTRITPERRSVDQFYSLIPPGLPRFAEYSCKKAHTPYRPNSTHREAEHDKNPQHRMKTALYFSNPVKPHFAIDSKQLIKIQFYSPQNYNFCIQVKQYSSIPDR
jgi:hypothetical protein